MNKLGASVVVAGLLFGTLVAQAAPPSARPTPTVAPSPTPTPTFAPVVPSPPVAEVTAVPTKCGEPAKVRVKLTNKSGGSWNGVISFVATVAAAETLTPVTLGASGVDAVKTVDVLGAKIDCKKPLTTQSLRIYKEGAPGTSILQTALKAKTISADAAFAAPAETETKVWVRRASVKATCAGMVTATMTLYANEKTKTQEVKAKVGFGIYVSDQVVQVPPSAPKEVGVPVPTPLDCQAAGGIPAFEYNLYYGLPANAVGKLEAQEVTFAP